MDIIHSTNQHLALQLLISAELSCLSRCHELITEQQVSVEATFQKVCHFRTKQQLKV